ncbi:MAG: hypothetical protein IPK63_11370 [Candidatus Competibacteraceae bacterium]|nr:hypothetical protein [Candidatus Competibacteraceae bacterium]
MKLLAGIIITLFLSVWLALALKHDPGYAMFSMGNWTIETSFAFFLIVLALFFTLFYFLVRLAIRFWKSPALTSAANRQWQQEKSQKLLNVGTQQLAAGHGAAAEKTLLKAAVYSQNPAQHYLNAARATHQFSDEKWRRDLHLRRAEDCPGTDKVAVQLTRVEFLLDDHQAEQAQPIIESLRAAHPHHPGVLQWLAKTYQQLKAWEPLQNLLPELQKQKVLGPQPLAELQHQTYRALLESAAASSSLDKLRALWKQAPAALRENDEAFLVDYATALRDCDAIDEAETLLRETIKRRWNSKLVVGYGMLERGNAAAQLSTAEGWLAQHGDDPYLLLTLGRLAKRCQQNDKARDYLERSIKLLPTPDAYQELGELAESARELTYAGQCFHSGLRLLIGKPLEKQGAMLPATDAAQLQGPGSSSPTPTPAS